jgi:catechol 2,3-dioxygenase-like lactoylglutathione lyase family enzyme
MLKFGHTEIFVSDPMLSKDFYEKILGFEVETVQHEGKVVWLKKGDATFLLRGLRKSSEAKTYQDAASALVLYTEDLPNAVTELKSRGLEFKGFDGPETCLTFTDLDGNWFQLVDPNIA